MRLVESRRRTESPFDHVGYAAQKRIDAALRKPHGPSLPEEIEGSDAVLRPPEETLPETTHVIDAEVPPVSETVAPNVDSPSGDGA
jgi:hypothetical protein